MDLADIVAPLAQDEFLGQVLGQDMRLLRGEPGRFADLLTWPALNDMLAHHRLEHPWLRLAWNGQIVPVDWYSTPVRERDRPEYHRLDVAALTERLAEGATLVIDNIDQVHQPVADLAGTLEHRLRQPVHVNLFASWACDRGFGVHWDDHDVLVLQVAGRKRWQIFGPARHWPLYRDVEPNTRPPVGGPLADVVLEAGDALHVPRGWWHLVTALDEPSLHLSVGISQRTGVDLMAWLADQLRDNDLFRQDLPWYGDPGQLGVHVRDLGDTVRAAFADPDLLVTRFLADQDAAAPARPRFCLPHAASPGGLPPDPDDLPVTLMAPRAVLEQEDGRVTLAVGGRLFRFAAEAEPLLRSLLDGRPVTIQELCARADRFDLGTVRSLVAELVSEGVAAIG